MALEFGIWEHFERLDDVPPARQYRERITFVQRAEELGFAGYQVAEHHLSPLSMAPSPLTWLSVLGPETSRIRLGAAVVIVPLYPPVRLAEEICVADALTAGRLEVGVGRGIRDPEHEWFGVDATTTRAAMQGALEVIREALLTGKITVESPTGRGSAPFVFEPTQRPLPPFWYVGNLEYAAEQGMSVLGHRPSAEEVAQYFATFAERRSAGSPYHQHEPRLGSTRQVLVMASGDAARARARSAFASLGDHFWATEPRVAGNSWVRGGPLGPGIPVEQAIAQGQIVVGEPDEVVAQLDGVLAHSGPQYNYLVNSFQWGNLTHEEAMANLELFVTAVAPRLREAHAARDTR